jgi:hypothetical protein
VLAAKILARRTAHVSAESAPHQATPGREVISTTTGEEVAPFTPASAPRRRETTKKLGGIARSSDCYNNPCGEIAVSFDGLVRCPLVRRKTSCEHFGLTGWLV